MYITREIFAGYLKCKYKAYLQRQGTSYPPHEYTVLSGALDDDFNRKAKTLFVVEDTGTFASRQPPISLSDLRTGLSSILDATIQHEIYSFRFDAVQRVAEKSELGKFSYIPVLFTRTDTIQAQHRLVLAFGGIVLGLFQGHAPSVGIVVHGRDCKRSTVKLDACHRKVDRILDGVREVVSGGTIPPVILNDHCRQCPYSERCNKLAVADDHLSLLDRMNEPEIARLHRKGIFTVTQLSYTFRPRRRNKRVKAAARPFNLALQALAIRENSVYVASRPQLPDAKTRVYLDMEGDSTGNSVYLIGLAVVIDNQDTFHSLWSDREADEEAIFRRLFGLLERLHTPYIYHYGSYEARVVKRMIALSPPEDVVRTLTDRTINVLATIHSEVYFPCYSNSLKDVGHFLGCKWSSADASGLQSIVWRAHWERSQDHKFKADLLQYNHEDCQALRRVTEFLYTLQNQEITASSPCEQKAVTFVESLKPSEDRHKYGNMQSAVEGFGHIVHCAYFDYQTSKVYIRTNPNLKVANRRRRKKKGTRLHINQVVEHSANRCQHCQSRRLAECQGVGETKTTIDLKFSRAGIRKLVTKHHTRYYRCPGCGRQIVPKDFKSQPHFGSGVVAWAMYQYVANRMSLSQIELTAQECFGFPLPVSRCHLFKEQLAAKYKATVAKLTAKIVAGDLAHMDETTVRLKKESGYVFVITNMEEVVYFYRPTRATDFLEELLKGFDGVLVTDFYSGYDFLKCLQQKCLVHLVRDLNEDVLKNPFDQELVSIAQGLGSLMRKIVDTIDRYGLKARYLGKHKPEAQRWVRILDGQTCVSDVAEGYRKRIVKYHEKLFTFLDHDGIPWNNNNAEHAIKPFAKYRRLINGQITEGGLSDYLVLLSLQQTCEYRGIRFLDFLLSEEVDIDVYCESH